MFSGAAGAAISQASSRLARAQREVCALEPGGAGAGRNAGAPAPSAAPREPLTAGESEGLQEKGLRGGEPPCHSQARPIGVRLQNPLLWIEGGASTFVLLGP